MWFSALGHDSDLWHLSLRCVRVGMSNASMSQANEETERADSAQKKEGQSAKLNERIKSEERGGHTRFKNMQKNF